MKKFGMNQASMKALGLLLFLILAFVLVRFTPIRDYLTTERLTGLVETTGAWAPAAFMVLYAAGVCLFVPGTLLAIIGAALFGPYLGFVYVWGGAMVGACLAFLIGRHLGRDFATGLIGDRLKRYDRAIERNGFATTLYLRLIYFPFTLMNFGMGLTGVKFRDYFFGTALGILVGTFIFTFAIGTIRDILAKGNYEELLGGQVLLAVGMFIFSFFIPMVVKRLKRDES